MLYAYDHWLEALAQPQTSQDAIGRGITLPRSGGFCRPTRSAIPPKPTSTPNVGNDPTNMTDPSGMTDVDIYIYRDEQTSTRSTSGTMTVTNGTDTVQTRSLEPPPTGNHGSGGNGTVDMAPGDYKAHVRLPVSQGGDSHHSVPVIELEGTVDHQGKAHSNVEIHPGNTPRDTMGCILPGTASGTDSVSGSRAAHSEIMGVVQGTQQSDAAKGDSTNITVHIRDYLSPFAAGSQEEDQWKKRH